MYNTKIVADSISPNGIRLTTFEWTYPLIIHAEVMTHRMFSRNVASNRAIPVEKMIKAVTENPFIPERFPRNKAGMQNEEWLEGQEAEDAKVQWLIARDRAVEQAETLRGLNVHKQITNRILGAFLWTTAVVTATDYNNFFGLRRHEMAQPEIQKVAYPAYDQYHSSEPVFVDYGDWHLPYVSAKEKEEFGEDAIYISDGRCARISYLSHGEDNVPEKDIELAVKLSGNGHWSPFEHPATPLKDGGYCGNLRGWMQHRKFFVGEYIQ